MNFLRKLFGVTSGDAREERQEREERDFDVLKYDGVAALRQHAVDHAVKCFSHALELKDDGETRDYLAQALIQTGQLHEAFGQLDMLARTEPDNVRILLRMADVAYMMEDYDAMTDVCERAQAVDARNAHVCYAYARARIGSKDFVNAIALLGKAIALAGDEPPMLDACLLRGQTLLKMNDAELAERDADQLLQHVADNEDVLLLKARCRELQGDHAAALEAYDRVVEANPFCAEAFKERGSIRVAVGDETGAANDASMWQELAGGMTAEAVFEPGSEDIARQTEQAYKAVNPLGL